MNFFEYELFWQRLKKFKKSFIFLSFILGIVFAASLYKNSKIIYYKDSLEYVLKTGPSFITNYFSSSTDSLETIFLDIKFKEWRKLVNQRNKIWNYSTVFKYFPFQWTDSIDKKKEIKGKMTFNSQSNKVKLELTGMNYDHFGDSKKWSYRISVKGDNVIDRQKKFNLLIPTSRGYINDFIAQTFLHELNMISLRVKPVKLVLNGDDMGTYLKEEFYDKRLIEYNKYRESAILRLKDDFSIEISEAKYIKYKSIIDKFNKKLALFIEGSINIEEIINIDKMSDRLALSVLFGDSHSLLDLNQRYYLNPFTVKLEPLGREFMYSSYENKDFINQSIKDIKNVNSVSNKLFSNNEFLNKFNKSISKIISQNFIQNIFKKNIDEIENMEKIFHSEYPFFESNESLIYSNAKFLRENKNWLQILNNVNYDTPQINNINLLNKVKNDTIFIDQSITIYDKLYIPKGYTVHVKSGVNISLEKDGQILSESPFYAKGSVNDSIRFISNTSNRGILFLNTNKSYFEYVNFKGISNYYDEYRSLPGSVTFFESPVIIKNCSFNTSIGGDDLLNIVSSEFEISNSEFLNSLADALDSDFSTGLINNTLFKNIGNDAIDISTSNITLNGINIINAKDKGLSVGEDSRLIGNNINIYDTSLPLSCKDLSIMTLNDVKIINSDVVFSVFQKKPEYGPASINSENIIFSNYKKNYLVQENNNLIINSKKITKKIKDVESKLYGKFYGKSSK
jgi:hypothetical protein